MVSNKKRNVLYRDLSVTQDAAQEFDECAVPGETRSDTLKKIIKGYKNNCKCPSLADRGVTIAE